MQDAPIPIDSQRSTEASVGNQAVLQIRCHLHRLEASLLDGTTLKARSIQHAADHADVDEAAIFELGTAEETLLEAALLELCRVESCARELDVAERETLEVAPGRPAPDL